MILDLSISNSKRPVGDEKIFMKSDEMTCRQSQHDWNVTFLIICSCEISVSNYVSFI